MFRELLAAPSVMLYASSEVCRANLFSPPRNSFPLVSESSWSADFQCCWRTAPAEEVTIQIFISILLKTLVH